MAIADTSKAVGMHRKGEGRIFWVAERLVLVVLSHQSWLWCTKPTTVNLILDSTLVTLENILYRKYLVQELEIDLNANQ